MKTLIKTIALLSATIAASANASISVEHDNSTEFDIGGIIAPECKVNSTATDDALALDLTSTSAQNIASVEIWCNTGDQHISATYTSDNNGVLKNDTHNGKDIAYKINVGSAHQDLSLTSARTVNQEAGSDVEGESVAKTISIEPEVTGFEYEGTYSDTITVTVAYN